MTNKSYFTYHILFTIIKVIMNNHNLKFVNDNIMVMADFELRLRNVLKEIFLISY